MLFNQIFLEENQRKSDFSAGYYDLKPERLIRCYLKTELIRLYNINQLLLIIPGSHCQSQLLNHYSDGFIKFI